MLHSLRVAIESDDYLRDQVAIEGVFFYTHLATRHMPNATPTSTRHLAISNICAGSGILFPKGISPTLATIININGNHWVSVIVDFQNDLVNVR